MGEEGVFEFDARDTSQVGRGRMIEKVSEPSTMFMHLVICAVGVFGVLAPAETRFRTTT